MVVSPDKVLVASGSSASFECLTFTSDLNVSLTVTWEYPAGADIVVEGAKLIIVNATASSEGDYKCIVHSSLQKTVTTVGVLRIGMYTHMETDFLLTFCSYKLLVINVPKYS